MARQEWYKMLVQKNKRYRVTLTLAWAGVERPCRKQARGLVGFEGWYAVIRMLRGLRHSK